jgi:alkylation response protein AidB-like acyl-CoA dehydrogenase
VRVPLANVVGTLGEGWAVAMALLGFERGRDAGREASLERALAEVHAAVGRQASDGQLERLGELAAWVYAYRQGSLALMSTLDAGGSAGVIPNILKLIWSECSAEIYEEAWRVRGEEGEILESADAFGPWTGWQREYWHSRAAKIFAGSNQIQKNIIAQSGLRLPREPEAGK